LIFQALRLSQSSYVKRTLLNYLIAFESILLVALTFLAVEVRHVGEDVSPVLDSKIFTLLAAFPIMWLCCLSLFGAWDITILDSHIEGYRRLLKSSFMTFLAFSSASYLFKIQISRFVILFSLLGGTILHLILRWTFLQIVEKRLKKEIIQDRWLVLNKGDKTNSTAERFSGQFNAEVIYLNSFNDSYDFKIWADGVSAEIKSQGYKKVLLPEVDWLSPDQIEYLAWVIQLSDVELVIYNQLGSLTTANQVRIYEDLNWMGILTPQINDSLRVVKRLFDLLLVIPAIIFLSPFFLTIAIFLKLDSRGKLLYTQIRIGQDGKNFKFPKFRTMRPGSDTSRLEVLGRPDENMVERYRNDPRITRFGKFLRRYSLDELPQLWCVLIGTMSLVGPRPILPQEEEQLGDFHFRRQIAKPGLTGIWQVSGRKDTSWDERMAFDIKYVQDWSIALDLILICRTLPVS
jgi:exopolysaccharide biosynthesis polyprenyl glycosylphosphotransferase